ncbi:hypothetical protein A3218_17910 [Pseudomonas chlororaphis]|uniref:hypothetical protein n=1 Tax=Pseudomonas chlororaphis TaxID=587753 RepID=UPI000789E14A|nr:hypothetical protein [Pseudomonas chlororaphis]AMS16090.1 hypothetical protein A3218_17910 [Pseudomonas chlororaphis]
MTSSHNETTKPSIHADRAYSLILSAVLKCETAQDQLLLINSILSQCAIFICMLSGEQEFHALLDRLKDVDLEEIRDGLRHQQIH